MDEWFLFFFLSTISLPQGKKNNIQFHVSIKSPPVEQIYLSVT